MHYKLCYKKQSANTYHKYLVTNSYWLAHIEKEKLKNKTIKNRKTLRIIKNPTFNIFKLRKTAEKRLLRRCPF